MGIILGPVHSDAAMTFAYSFDKYSSVPGTGSGLVETTAEQRRQTNNYAQSHLLPKVANAQNETTGCPGSM